MILLTMLVGIACSVVLGASAAGSHSGSVSVDARGGRLIRANDPPPRRSRGWSLQVDSDGEAAPVAEEFLQVDPDGEWSAPAAGEFLQAGGLRADELAAPVPPPTPAMPVSLAPLSAACSKVVTKAQNLLNFTALELKDNHSKLHVVVKALESRNKSSFVAEDILEALGNVSLKTALKSGYVWTVEDQRALFDNCLEDDPLQALEERRHTPTGEPLFQGDMLLGENWLSEEGIANQTVRLGTANWPKGQVHYCFAQNITNLSRIAFLSAVKHLESQVPCLSFKQVQPREVLAQSLQCAENEHVTLPQDVEITMAWFGDPKDVTKRLNVFDKVRELYRQGNSSIHAKKSLLGSPTVGNGRPVLKVFFSEGSDVQCASSPAISVGSDMGSGCWSDVGVRSADGGQRLNLGRGCGLMGIAAHQLLQALGVGHEFSHRRRDEFVDIIMENTNAFLFDTNFQISESGSGPSSVDFDPLSIMGGSAKAFSANGKATVELKAAQKPLPLMRQLLGQRLGLSEVDVLRLSERYGCALKATPISPTKRLSQIILEGGGLSDDGGCSDQDYTGIMAQVQGSSEPVNMKCDDLEDKCSMPEFSERMAKRCPRTCMTCVQIQAESEEGSDEPGGEAADATASLVDASDLIVQATGRGTLLVEQDPIKEANVTAAFACEDSNVTGIKHRLTNVDANCTELVAFCSHAEMGKAVKAACAKSCGTCGVPSASEASVPTPAPVPSWRCKDSLVTGVRFQTGQPATCPELFNYCDHQTLDDHIKLKCPLTCGLCATAMTQQATSSGGNSGASKSTGPCEDAPADRAPVLWLGDTALDCAVAKDFCFGHPNSKHLAKKCKVTCGVCGLAEEELEDVGNQEPNATTSAPPVETTIYTPAFEGYDGPSCSRRRVWGFCDSRRRRDA